MKTFSRGNTTYKCECCTRVTRYTGAQSYGSKLCPQCWELAGLENDVQDGHETVAYYAVRIAELVAELHAKGGNVAEWLETFERLSEAK